MTNIFPTRVLKTILLALVLGSLLPQPTFAQPPSAPLCAAPLPLTAYPRPINDNGWGIHFGAGAADPEDAAIHFFVEGMAEMNIRWAKILNRGTDLVTDRLVDALVDAGIEPIMRIEDEDLAPFHPPDLTRLVTHYTQRGVHYFELYNEPNLLDEWPSDSDIDIGYLLDVWIPAAHAIQEAGGYPSTPALAPGGHWEDTDFWHLFLTELRHRAEIGDRLAFEALCGNEVSNRPGLWIANHNYGLNHYFDYPADAVNRDAKLVDEPEMNRYGITPDIAARLNHARQAQDRPFYVGDFLSDDSNGFFKFLAQAETFRRIIGYTPPVLITEGGWLLNDQQDARYPPVTETFLHNETMRGYQYMQTEAPDFLLTWMPWLLCNFACGGTDPRFEGHAWYKHRSANATLSVVKALKESPAKIRYHRNIAHELSTQFANLFGSTALEGTNKRWLNRTHSLATDALLSRPATDLVFDAATRMTDVAPFTVMSDPKIKTLPDPLSPEDRLLIFNTSKKSVTTTISGQVLFLAPLGQVVVDGRQDMENRTRTITDENRFLTSKISERISSLPIVRQVDIQSGALSQDVNLASDQARFGVAEMRRLSCDENRGQATLFVEVLGDNREPLDGVRLHFNTIDGDNPFIATSGHKAPGRAEFALVSGQGGGHWTIQVADESGGSRLVTGLRTDLPDDPCLSRGNSTGHYSYAVTFQQGATDVIGQPRQPLQIAPNEWSFPRARTIPTTPLSTVSPRPLSTWPRPIGDNGWGLHFLPLAAFDEATLDLFIYHMLELDLRWATVYYEDAVTLRRAGEKFQEAGMMVVWRPKLRPYEAYSSERIERDLDILRDVGMPPYLQLYNEPTLAQEWDGRSIDWLMYLENFLTAADHIYALGGYVGVQDIDPASLARLLDVVKQEKPYLLSEMFFLPHCYGSNHPPDYPYDALNQATLNQSTTGIPIETDYNASVLCFLKYAQVWQESVGYVPPMIMSEGGWASNTLEDGRYPRITLDDHRDYHQALFDWFRTGTLSNSDPLPDYLFAVTPWLIGGAGQMQFEENGWFYSKLTGSKFDTIEALRNTPPFERQFHGQTSVESIAPIKKPIIKSQPAVTVTRQTLIINTADYHSALSQVDDFLYPRLTGQVGPAKPTTYEAIVMENAQLKIIILPELGGRIYQIFDKHSGQQLLYNNEAIQPTAWGPPEMNWWLLAGGIEWAFPVAEHGYAWAMPWESDALIKDGTAVTRLWWRDPVTGLIGSVVIELPENANFFHIQFTLINDGQTAQPAQFWWNAAFPAGEGMRTTLPAQSMVIHSIGPEDHLQPGDRIPWTEGVSLWGSWQSWFSGFVEPPTTGISMDIFGAGDGPGIRRVFEPDKSPGIKLVVMTDRSPAMRWTEQPYLEIWGGMNQDFRSESDVLMNPDEKYTWRETWQIIPRQNNK